MVTVDESLTLPVEVLAADICRKPDASGGIVAFVLKMGA
jgi:hypothetical protein